MSSIADSPREIVFLKAMRTKLTISHGVEIVDWNLRIEKQKTNTGVDVGI
jgi:hypothetical protein